ncbi:hypothetical protein, partial [Gordonia sp. (in: high G+C Gram-positive bacteria)]|uniref:hypothetical protein n=1 Tax=Gordonia sp. (in: high G+C Gram-positive bacteria) TaxID=84139 RepID=UPI002620822F
MTQAEVAGRINTVKKAHAFLDWTQFQGALVIYDQVAAKAAAEAVEDAGRAAHKLLDVDAQVILCLAQYVEGTEHQGAMLLDDAFAARDRLPRCAVLLRD